MAFVHNSLASRPQAIDGISWVVYDNRRSRADVGNAEYALATQAGASSYVLYGTADDDEFVTLARALQPNISANTARPI